MVTAPFNHEWAAGGRQAGGSIGVPVQCFCPYTQPRGVDPSPQLGVSMVLIRSLDGEPTACYTTFTNLPACTCAHVHRSVGMPAAFHACKEPLK